MQQHQRARFYTTTVEHSPGGVLRPKSVEKSKVEKNKNKNKPANVQRGKRDKWLYEIHLPTKVKA